MSRVLTLCAFFFVVVVVFGAGAAHAQLCGEVDAQPDEVFHIFSDRLEGVVPIEDASICEKITKAAVAACHKAVADTASCHDGIAGGLAKGLKPGCATFVDPKDCSADLKAQLENDESNIAEDAATTDPICDGVFADEILELCLEGFPDPV